MNTDLLYNLITELTSRVKDLENLVKVDKLINWKPLDIDDLPERFFTRDDIEVERILLGHNDNVIQQNKLCNKLIIITELSDNYWKFRYRIIKKKEEIYKINQRSRFIIEGEMKALDLWDINISSCDNINNFLNVKVSIID